MTNEEKINQIMGSVELFYKIIAHQGISFDFEIRTDYLEVLYNKSKPYVQRLEKNLNEKLIKLREQSAMFPLILEDWTKESDFNEKWNKMSWDEKDYILSFNKNSYKIIRKVIPAEDVYEVMWRTIAEDEISVKLNEKFLENLNLSKTLINPPNTKEKLVLWKQIMLESGFNEEDVENFNADEKINKNNYDYKLFHIISNIRKTDKIDINIKKLTKVVYDTNIIVYMKKNDMERKENFFINNELEFKKIKFKEDLESKLNEKKVEIKNTTKKI